MCSIASEILKFSDFFKIIKFVYAHNLQNIHNLHNLRNFQLNLTFNNIPSNPKFLLYIKNNFKCSICLLTLF